MNAISSVWRWIRDRSMSFLLLLIAIIGALMFWRTRKQPILSADVQAEVDKAREKIAELNAVRDAVLARVEEKDEAIATIDRQLQDNRRRIVEAVDGSAGLSNEEIRRRFDRLGY